MYRRFRRQANFYVVYIAEAHAVNGWQTESNEAEGIRIPQATTFEERWSAAERCAAALGLSIPTLVDGMDDAARLAFAAWPERIFVFDRDGKLTYMGGPGPFGFDVGEAVDALRRLEAQG
ncbi:MAG: hypothetical protein IT332_02990 [Ardenticatenales bacterium]|nr:hypothetical protein [Ardenticatenales bacterium]